MGLLKKSLDLGYASWLCVRAGICMQMPDLQYDLGCLHLRHLVLVVAKVKQTVALSSSR